MQDTRYDARTLDWIDCVLRGERIAHEIMFLRQLADDHRRNGRLWAYHASRQAMRDMARERR